MTPPRRSALWRAGVLAMSMAVLLAGCTSSGPTSQPTSQAAPLPTEGTHVDLLCGFVPRSSIETALGRSDFTASGGVTAAGSANPDGTTFARAQCGVSLPEEAAGEAPAFSVKVAPVVLTDADIARTANSGDFSYPDVIGIGFASRDSFTDSRGVTHRTCESGLLRGDWAITLGIQTPAPGRNVLDDTVALAQEIVNGLKIPREPTTPYPADFTPSS
jgi:hypothetical protein